MNRNASIENINELEEEKNSDEDLRPPVFRNSQQHGNSLSRSWSLEMLLRRLRALDDKHDDKLANIMGAMGEFGTFQRRLVALTFIPNMLSAFLMCADYFVFTEQTPFCNTSWILNMAPNLSDAEQLNLTVPRERDGSFKRCYAYLPVPWDLDSIINFGLNESVICKTGWVYPDSKTRSLINEFDLVCDKGESKDIVHTVFLAGVLSGSLIFGFLSDKFGRYPTILMSLLGMVIFGFGTAFVTNFHQYLFFRFVVSQAVVGYAISSVSLVMEWLVGEHQAHAVILEHCFFAVGIIILAGFAYNLPHWRFLFLAVGVPMLPFISYIWVLQESPQWLVMKGKVEEAKKVLCYAATVNKKPIPPNLLNELQPPGKKMTKVTFLDFFTNRHLLKVIMATGCVWFTVSYTYFTLCLKIKHLGTSVYFRQAIPGIMEVPARLCCIFLIEQIGKKWSLILMLTKTTMVCFLVLFLPADVKSIILLVIVFGEFTLASIITVFFVYTAELLPIALRSTGLGMVSLSWAAGGILSMSSSGKPFNQFSIFLCCVFAILALCFTTMVPETQVQLTSNNLGYSSKSSFQRDSTEDSFDFYRRRSREVMPMKVAEDSLSDDMSEEVAKNTLLNAQPLTLDSYTLFNTDLERPSNVEESGANP